MWQYSTLQHLISLKNASWGLFHIKHSVPSFNVYVEGRGFHTPSNDSPTPAG